MPIGLNAQLPLVIPAECIDLPRVPPDYGVIVPTGSLRDEFILEALDENGCVPRSDVVVPQLPIVIEAAGEHFSVQGNKDRVVQSTGSLDDLTRGETSDDLWGHFVASVVLSKLPIVVPANTINLSERLPPSHARACLCGAPLLCHNDRVIVAT